MQAALRSHECPGSILVNDTRPSTPLRQETTTSGLPHYDTPLGRGPYLTGVARPPRQQTTIQQTTIPQPTIPQPKPILRVRSNSPARCDISETSSSSECEHHHVEQRLVIPLRNVQEIRRVGPEQNRRIDDRPGFLETICNGVSELLGGTRTSRRRSSWSRRVKHFPSSPVLNQSPMPPIPPPWALVYKPSIRGVSAPPVIRAEHRTTNSCHPPYVKRKRPSSQPPPIHIRQRVVPSDCVIQPQTIFPKQRPVPSVRQQLTQPLKQQLPQPVKQPQQSSVMQHLDQPTSPQSSIRSIELPTLRSENYMIVQPSIIRAPVPSYQTYRKDPSTDDATILVSPKSSSQHLVDCHFSKIPKAYKQCRPSGTIIKRALCVGIGYMGKVCELSERFSYRMMSAFIFWLLQRVRLKMRLI